MVSAGGVVLSVIVVSVVLVVSVVVESVGVVVSAGGVVVSVVLSPLTVPVLLSPAEEEGEAEGDANPAFCSKVCN